VYHKSSEKTVSRAPWLVLDAKGAVEAPGPLDPYPLHIPLRSRPFRFCDAQFCSILPFPMDFTLDPTLESLLSAMQCS
jgi:hypothetical protein